MPRSHDAPNNTPALLTQSKSSSPWIVTSPPPKHLSKSRMYVFFFLSSILHPGTELGVDGRLLKGGAAVSARRPLAALTVPINGPQCSALFGSADRWRVAGGIRIRPRTHTHTHRRASAAELTPTHKHVLCRLCSCEKQLGVA